MDLTIWQVHEDDISRILDALRDKSTVSLGFLGNKTAQNKACPSCKTVDEISSCN